MNRINFLPPWVETNLQPAFYDKESGTVLQQTARMYAKVNQLVRNVNEQNEAIELYIAKFIELKDYVEDYFANLDVQEEINNKLDDMVEQGTLQEIITAYIQSNVAWTFDTVADMKSSTNLIAGSYAHTLGYHSLNDGGDAFYKITDTGTADEGSIIALSDDLKAHLILTGDIKPELFGAYGDGTHNDSTAFNLCLAYAKSLEVSLNNEITGREIKLTKDYLIDKLSIPQGMAVTNIIGNKARIRTGGFTFNASTGWRVLIKGITFDSCATPINMDYRNLEYGRYEIKDCIFNRCTGVAVNIARKSCQTTIDGCTFRDCEKTATIDRSDMFIFTNNWIECTSVNPWGNEHSDVEHISPTGGDMAFIENNMFIPGYAQTGTNPTWVKVGGSAVIQKNRFSGENARIHPLRINHAFYSTYSPSSSLTPIINFVDNPIVTGNTSILFDNVRGMVNISENSGWINRMKVITLSDDTLADSYDALDVKRLQIAFSNNGGGSFNMREGRMTSSNIVAEYKPTIPDCLQKFVKTGVHFAENGNNNVVTTISDYVLNIDTGTTSFDKNIEFAVAGTVNKNPGGATYFENFLLIVGIERYYSSELRYRATVNVISKNGGEVEFTATINGQSYITSVPGGENITIQIAGSGTARPTFTGIQTLAVEPLTNKLCN